MVHLTRRHAQQTLNHNRKTPHAMWRLYLESPLNDIIQSYIFVQYPCCWYLLTSPINFCSPEQHDIRKSCHFAAYQDIFESLLYVFYSFASDWKLCDLGANSLNNSITKIWIRCSGIYVGVEGAAIFEVEVEHAWSGVTGDWCHEEGPADAELL